LPQEIDKSFIVFEEKETSSIIPGTIILNTSWY
jgi:hypothetical protein